MTRLCLPHIRDGGHIVNMGSIAGPLGLPERRDLHHRRSSPVRGFTRALREDLLGRADPRHRPSTPGLVETEFSLVRFRGDEEKAKSVYEGVAAAARPRTSPTAILFALTRPPHVNVDEMRRRCRSTRRAAPGSSVRSMLTILEGTTFCICDERGDVGDDTSGFFADDTRFSPLRLTIDGQRPLLLSSDQVEYFSAAFFLRNPLARGLPQDALSIIRSRFVGDAKQDRIVVQNERSSRVLRARLEFGSDFADIFTVKAYDFTLGDPVDAPPLPPLVEPRCDAGGQFVLADGEAGEDAGDPLAAGRVDGAGLRTRSSSSRASGGSSWSTSCLRRRRALHPDPPSTASARSSSTSATRSPPGSCACRSCARLGRSRAHVRAVGRRPRALRIRAATAASARCRPPACRGS